MKDVRINAKLVRQIMLNKELDQRDLARLSNISEQTITRLLQGKPFGSETLGKLAEALDCHPIDLIEAKGYVTPHMDAPIIATIRA